MPGRGGRWWDGATDLLLGSACAGCTRPGWGLCRACATLLSTGHPSFTRPDPCPPGFPRTVAAGPYDPLRQRLITAHKERQLQSLSPVLGAQLAGAVELLLRAQPPGPSSGPERSARSALGVCLVAVPSSTAVVRARGFDASWALARRAARDLRGRAGLDVVAARVLAQRRGVRDQAGLDARARAANVAGRLFVSGIPPADHLVVLVDDVVTTGSSLSEAARAVRAAGLPLLGAATVAATVRSRRAGPRDPRGRRQ